MSETGVFFRATPDYFALTNQLMLSLLRYCIHTLKRSFQSNVSCLSNMQQGEPKTYDCHDILDLWNK